MQNFIPQSLSLGYNNTINLADFIHTQQRKTNKSKPTQNKPEKNHAKKTSKKLIAFFLPLMSIFYVYIRNECQ